MKGPLYDNRGNAIPPWHDPRLSPMEQHREWIRAHVDVKHALTSLGLQIAPSGSYVRKARKKKGKKPRSGARRPR